MSHTVKMRGTLKGPLVAVAAFLVLLSFASLAVSAQPVGDNPESGMPMTDGQIAKVQQWLREKPVGERIAAWAGMFVGVPYDKDPLGAYVRSEKVVCDTEVDCMYLVFRAVELATSDTPQGAVDRALELRFRTRGRIEGATVVNYDERFEYGEDMIDSGKWGSEITTSLGAVKSIEGSRGKKTVSYVPKDELAGSANICLLRDGDVVFFVKPVDKRVVGEVIGHLGIIKVDGGVPYLIHGSGTKAAGDRPGGGEVKKTALEEYLRATNFLGVQVTRFQGAP